MTANLSLEGVILAIILGMLGAIVYSLRVLVLLERRISRIDTNLLRLTTRVLDEEGHIEAEEERIERLLSKSRPSSLKTRHKKR